LKKPELTIGISFYNTADTLLNLAKCIFAQTFTDWEWILIDDGSTDGGYEVISKIEDPRVRLIRDNTNRGRAIRYNYITEIALGDFIARFDADDLSHPARFQKQIEFLKAHRHVDVVSTGMLCLGPGDIPLGRRTPKALIHQAICSRPLTGFGIFHGPIMARTEWFKKHPYPEKWRIAVDYALFISSYYNSCFANISEPLYFYREYATHSLRKYYRTNIAVSQAIKQFAPPVFNSAQKLQARLARYSRIAAYILATAFGLQTRLISRRSPEALSEKDLKEFEAAIKLIRAAKVPGLDS
jgi:glycosyltransferase involved in cell wall biosynthesis